MMISKMADFERQLFQQLLKFKLYEFPELLQIVFNDVLKWETVCAYLDRKKLDQIRSNVARVCCDLYLKTGPSSDDVNDKARLLMLCDVSFHHKYQWFGIKLEMPFPDDAPSLDNIEKLVMRAYKQELRECQVRCIQRKDCLWLIVIEVKWRKNKATYGKPLFFAFNPSLNVPYAFVTPKVTDDDYPLFHFASALGFQDVKPYKLSGQNVPNLYKSIVQNPTEVALSRRPNTFGSRNGPELFKGDSKITTLTIDCVERDDDNDPSEARTSVVIECLPEYTMESVLCEMVASEIVRTPIPGWARSFNEVPQSFISMESHEF